MNMNCQLITFVCITSLFILKAVHTSDVTCSFRPQLIPSECKVNESCVQINDGDIKGVCKCKLGYFKRSTKEPCVAIPGGGSHNIDPSGKSDHPSTPEPNHSSQTSGSTIAASILIPVVLIALIVALVYSARRYRWLHKLYQLHQRRYDEVRIGQGDDDDDDPPIA